MQETWVQPLSQEDPLEEEMETHSSILAWRIPWTEELADDSSWGKKESDTTEQLTPHSDDTHSWDSSPEQLLLDHNIEI